MQTVGICEDAGHAESIYIPDAYTISKCKYDVIRPARIAISKIIDALSGRY